MSSTNSLSTMPKRGRPPKISRDQIVEAVLDIGLENLVLTEVARRIDVSIQTLYNHVRSKDDLIYLAAMALRERFPMPEDTGRDWGEWIYDAAHVLKRTCEHAPGFAKVIMSRTPARAPTLGEGWRMATAIASRSGFEPAVGLWASMAVQEFTCAWVARMEHCGDEPEYPTPKDYRRGGGVEAADVRLIEQACNDAQSLGRDVRFEVSLLALLAGLSQLRGRSLDEIKDLATLKSTLLA